jgi:hypothetical protein
LLDWIKATKLVLKVPHDLMEIGLEGLEEAHSVSGSVAEVVDHTLDNLTRGGVGHLD